MRTINEDHDVVVIDAASLDHPEHFDSPWLVQFADGQIDGYDTEDAACEFQRIWRMENGRDPMTGEIIK